MQPDQATFLLHTFLPQIQQEWETTKKVLTAIPDKNLDYRPDPKARTAPEIAWHMVSSEIWFFEGLIGGGFQMEEAAQPDDVKTVADIIAWYEEKAPPLLDALDALPGEKLATPVDFFGVMSHPAVNYLSFLIVHTVHHRGQLSTYLRPMGGKVPAIYGGSADEPFQAPQ